MLKNYDKIVQGELGDKKFFLGNEAIARGALESGIDVYTFYPGTPSSEVGEIFMDIFKEVNMKWVETSINEKVALEIAGAAYARGARAMVGMKNVGLNVASDPFVALATTKPKNDNSALVVLVADDPQQYSSAVEMDSRNYLKLLKIPGIEPSNPQECLDFTKYAFELSKKLKIPVILRTVTRIAHARSNVVIGKIKKSNMKDEFDLTRDVNVASRLYFLDLKEDQVFNRMNQALIISEESPLNKIDNENERNEYELGIITSGVSYNYALEALNFLELKAPLLKIGFINPLPEKKIVRFLKSHEQVLIVEENDPYLETQIMAMAQKNDVLVKIHGKDPFAYSKRNSLLPLVGELNPSKVAMALIKITGIVPNIDVERIYNTNYESIKRKPTLCPGCPHGTTAYALKRATDKIKSLTKKMFTFIKILVVIRYFRFHP